MSILAATLSRSMEPGLSYNRSSGPTLALEPACGPAVTLEDAAVFAGEVLEELTLLKPYCGVFKQVYIMRD